jgi:hypothetical protein
MYSLPTKDIEPGMAPGKQHVDEFLGNFTFGEEHLEDIMAGAHFY